MQTDNISVHEQTHEKIVVRACFTEDDKRTYDLLFEWHGGEYIDIRPFFFVRQSNAFEVINVWNAYENRARIPFTADALIKRVVEWGEDYSFIDVMNGVESACPPSNIRDYR